MATEDFHNLATFYESRNQGLLSVDDYEFMVEKA